MSRFVMYLERKKKKKKKSQSHQNRKKCAKRKRVALGVVIHKKVDLAATSAKVADDKVGDSPKRETHDQGDEYHHACEVSKRIFDTRLREGNKTIKQPSNS